MKKTMVFITFAALLFIDSVHASCSPGSVDPKCLVLSPSPSPYSGDDLPSPVSFPPSDPHAPSPSGSPSHEPSSSPANSPYSSPLEEPVATDAPTPSPADASYDDDFIPADSDSSETQESEAADGASKPVDPAIKKICDSTDHAQLCISSITPFLSSGTKYDTNSILSMEIKAAGEAAKSALTAAEKIATSATLRGRAANALEDCKEMYDSVLENLQDATEAMSKRDIGTMNSMLSAVISDISTCTDGFEGSRCPLEEHNKAVSQLASNCLAIVALLK